MIIFINAAFRNAAIVSAILFFPSKAPARLSEWWFVAQGADRVLFVDAESIERDGDVASYWVSQVLREPGNPAALIRAFMRTDCIKRQQTWSVVTRYDAKDHRLDPSSASYAEPQQIVAGTLGEAELDFVCAANRADTAGFPLKIDEVAFADALIADTAGVVQPAELHDRLRENPATAVIRSTAAQPATFGAEQHVAAGQPIVPPRDYAKGVGLPIAKDYDADETGRIYDIAYIGIQNGEITFELRGYNITDLAHAGSGQMMRFPATQKVIVINDLEIRVIAARADGLRYRVARIKSNNGGLPDCTAGDCDTVMSGAPTP